VVAGGLVGVASVGFCGERRRRVVQAHKDSDSTHLRPAKAAAAHVGLNPSNWESGQYRSPSRHITKQGPADLRLLLYQAANVARHHDPGLAAHYRRLMCDRGHTHISANSAIARKLAGRAWKILQTKQPYEIRDLDGNPIDPVTARAICAELAVPADTRRRNRATQQGRSPHDLAIACAPSGQASMALGSRQAIVRPRNAALISLAIHTAKQLGIRSELDSAVQANIGDQPAAARRAITLVQAEMDRRHWA